MAWVTCYGRSGFLRFLSYSSRSRLLRSIPPGCEMACCGERLRDDVARCVAAAPGCRDTPALVWKRPHAPPPVAQQHRASAPRGPPITRRARRRRPHSIVGRLNKRLHLRARAGAGLRQRLHHRGCGLRQLVEVAPLRRVLPAAPRPRRLRHSGRRQVAGGRGRDGVLDLLHVGVAAIVERQGGGVARRQAGTHRIVQRAASSRAAHWPRSVWWSPPSRRNPRVERRA